MMILPKLYSWPLFAALTCVFMGSNSEGIAEQQNPTDGVDMWTAYEDGIEYSLTLKSQTGASSTFRLAAHSNGVELGVANVKMACTNGISICYLNVPVSVGDAVEETLETEVTIFELHTNCSVLVASHLAEKIRMMERYTYPNEDVAVNFHTGSPEPASKLSQSHVPNV